ncbi:(Fe-S)-binding protein [Methanocella sp. MCL-LM]|uniref:(Fe-S)-binding protein n=1 Tax=Methanocella sp. MCL-LM TaxID=3412035 RepID=UPI003C723BBE
MIKDHIDDILKCTRCGRCRALCPVNEELGWESTNARGRMLLARALAEDVQPSEAMKNSFYTCLTCAMCSSTCPSGAKPDEVVEAARQELVRAGTVPPYYCTVADNIEKFGNPLGDSSSRSAWAPAGSTGKSDLIYFAGCLMSYRKQAEARAAFSLLSRFGAKLLEDERCCGSPLLRLGGKPATIEHNIRQIEQSGAKTIVTSCAGCYKTLKESYGLDVEVLHITQFLARKVDELGLKPLPLKLTYHDPCHLGRCMKVYEEPRLLIRRIGSFTEMASSKQDARCCGGGGGVRRGYKDLAQKVAAKRLNEVPAGTDYIVTACPMCNSNLEDAGGKVIDICDLILKSISQK